MRQSFLKGTLILFMAGIVSRLLGFVPRVLLPRWIGIEGIGLFQMGYPAMLMLMTILSGGLPVAVAKLIAEARLGEERRIFRYAMWMTIVAGSILMLGTFALSPWIVKSLFPDERVRPVFLMICPIVFIIGISSIYRGYFQGKHNMMPTAVSQIVESVVRSGAMLVLALYFLPQGIQYAATGAMAGVLCGELAGLLTLMNWRRAHAEQPQEGPPRAIVGSLVRLSLPVTGSRMIGAFSHWMESLVIVRSLVLAGVGVGLATSQYGMLAGIVIPTLLMPGAITFSLGVSLIPALSEAAALHDDAAIRKRMGQSIRVALLTGGPFAVLMFVLAQPMCALLYGNADAARMLQTMALVSMFIYVQTPLQAALQALDRPMEALLNSLAGAIVKLSLIYIFITRMQLGIVGAAFALNIYIVLVTVLHWRSVAKVSGMKVPGADLAVIGIGMVAMGSVCKVVYARLPMGMLVNFGVAGAAGTLVFVGLMVVTGRLDREDVLRFLPRYFRST
jgi:stage V sporulation protein B